MIAEVRLPSRAVGFAQVLRRAGFADVYAVGQQADSEGFDAAQRYSMLLCLLIILLSCL